MLSHKKTIKLQDILFYCSMFLILGCSMTSAMNNINTSDGVNRKEAKIIAKNELLRLNLDDEIKKNPLSIYESSEVKYSNKKIDSDIHLYDVFDSNGNPKFEDAWYVLFKPKFISISTGFLTVVDKKNGEIVYSQSGDFVEGMVVPLLEKKINDHEKYMKAAIAFHKENKQWPATIDELRDYLDNPNEDINNLSITIKNEEEMSLFHKNTLWTYVLKFSNGDYSVKFDTPQTKPENFRDSIGNMLDSIEFEKL